MCYYKAVFPKDDLTQHHDRSSRCHWNLSSLVVEAALLKPRCGQLCSSWGWKTWPCPVSRPVCGGCCGLPCCLTGRQAPLCLPPPAEAFTHLHAISVARPPLPSWHFSVRACNWNGSHFQARSHSKGHKRQTEAPSVLMRIWLPGERAHQSRDGRIPCESETRPPEPSTWGPLLGLAPRRAQHCPVSPTRSRQEAP